MKNLAIKIENVEKYYGEFHALKNISFSVEAGRKIVVCGSSGSGKSTFVRCIGALEKFHSGNIEIFGKPNGGGGDRKGGGPSTCMVFQDFQLFPHLTVMENCCIAQIKVLRRDKREAEAIASGFVSKVGMEGYDKRYPAELSGGQKQRVAIARALCMEPKILLFDEPTSALDPESVEEVLNTMLELSSEGITMVAVTHEISFARSFADEMIFMANGEIVERGCPEELVISPKSMQAERFMRRVIK